MNELIEAFEEALIELKKMNKVQQKIHKQETEHLRDLLFKIGAWFDEVYPEGVTTANFIVKMR